MKWPTWDQAAIAAVVSGLIALGLRRWRPGRSRYVEPTATEFALIALLYSLWRVARKLPLAKNEGAIERARTIVDIQEAFLLPTELWAQQLVLRSDIAGWFSSLYYAILHVPVTIAFLFWLFFRHRDAYPRWRNGLVFVTGASLFIRFIRVAPPRFLVDLGYIDLSEKYGPSVYGPVGTGVSDQFAAMPSIHVGWAAVVSFGVFATSPSKWRWVALSHVFVTTFIVAATGHHWWLDSIVAAGLLGVGLLLDSGVRRLLANRSPAAESDATDEESSGTDVPVSNAV